MGRKELTREYFTPDITDSWLTPGLFMLLISHPRNVNAEPTCSHRWSGINPSPPALAQVQAQIMRLLSPSPPTPNALKINTLATSTLHTTRHYHYPSWQPYKPGLAWLILNSRVPRLSFSVTIIGVAALVWEGFVAVIWSSRWWRCSYGCSTPCPGWWCEFQYCFQWFGPYSNTA